MKFYLYILIYIININFAFSDNLYESNFNKVEIITNNAEKTKKDSINKIQLVSLIEIAGRIMDDSNKKKFLSVIKKNNLSNNIVRNIIIENEIITYEKYIAEIKINFNKEQILDILRDYKINYSDVISQPYLILSTYNHQLVNSGLDKDNLFLNNIRKNNKFKSFLLKFDFPNLDNNDRYILPYKKMINLDKDALKKILVKYSYEKAIYIAINIKNNFSKVKIYIYNRNDNKHMIIGDFDISYAVDQNEKIILDTLISNIILYLDHWWKKSILIDNNKYDSIKCLISSKNFEDLNKIRSKIINLSQVKDLNRNQLNINNNIETIYFYGDANILSKSLGTQGIIMKNKNNCKIFSKS